MPPVGTKRDTAERAGERLQEREPPIASAGKNLTASAPAAARVHLRRSADARDRRDAERTADVQDVCGPYPARRRTAPPASTTRRDVVRGADRAGADERVRVRRRRAAIAVQPGPVRSVISAAGRPPALSASSSGPASSTDPSSTTGNSPSVVIRRRVSEAAGVIAVMSSPSCPPCQGRCETTGKPQLGARADDARAAAARHSDPLPRGGCEDERARSARAARSPSSQVAAAGSASPRSAG